MGIDDFETRRKLFFVVLTSYSEESSRMNLPLVFFARSSEQKNVSHIGANGTQFGCLANVCKHLAPSSSSSTQQGTWKFRFIHEGRSNNWITALHRLAEGVGSAFFSMGEQL